MPRSPTTLLRAAAHLVRRFFTLLLRAIIRHRVLDLGAQLAYWSLLAMFPFVIFLLTLVGYLPLVHLDRQLMDWLAPFMPEAALQLVWETVHEVIGRQRGGLLAVSLLGGLWSASRGITALTSALNAAYGVDETRPFLRRKIGALVVTLAATVLLIVAVAAATIGPGVIRWCLDLFQARSSYRGLEETWSLARWPVAIGALVGVVAAIYTVLPNVPKRVHLVSIGSLVAVLGWIGVSWVFRHFVAVFGNYARTYGALGTVVMLLTWIYLSGITVIIGAEVNAAWGKAWDEVKDGDPVT